MKTPALLASGLISCLVAGCTPAQPPVALESCGLPQVTDSVASGIFSTVYHCNLSRERTFVKAATDARGNVTANIQTTKGDIVEICQVVSIVRQPNGFNFAYDFNDLGYSVKAVNITGYRGQSVRITRGNGSVSYQPLSTGQIQDTRTDETIFICNTTEV